MVDGVAMAKQHQRTGAKRTRTGQQLNQGGIIDIETFVDISNVQLVCGNCHQLTRVGPPDDDRGRQGAVLPQVRGGALDGGRPTCPGSRRGSATRSCRPLREQLGLTNVMQVPRLDKIVVNMGVGEALKDGRMLDAAVEDLTIIAGQKPVVTKARKSIAGFKLREGNAIGVKVTLRGDRMWEFYDRLVSLALPRIRDFRGLDPRSFDGRGNYTFGVTEQLIFPEIDYDKVAKVRGMDITIVTTARTDDEGRALLLALGFPLVRDAGGGELSRGQGTDMAKKASGQQAAQAAEVPRARLHAVPALRALARGVQASSCCAGCASASWRTWVSCRG